MPRKKKVETTTAEPISALKPEIETEEQESESAIAVSQPDEQPFLTAPSQNTSGKDLMITPKDCYVHLNDIIKIYCLGDVYELCCDAALRSRLACLLDSDLECEHPLYIPF